MSKLKDHIALTSSKLGEYGILDSNDNLFIKSLKCDACHGVLAGFDAVVSNSLVQTVAEDVLGFICSMYIYKDACYGFTKNLGQIVVENAVAVTFSPHFFCEDLLSICNTHYYKEDNTTLYIDQTLADKPQVIQDDNYVNALY